MEDNKDLVSSTVTEQETSEVQKGEDKKEKMYSRDELYKIVNAEKNKVRDELLKEAEKIVYDATKSRSYNLC